MPQKQVPGKQILESTLDLTGVDGSGVTDVDAVTLNGNADTFFAPINNAALTGTPTATTPTGSDDSTKIATTAFVQSESILNDSGTSFPVSPLVGQDFFLTADISTHLRGTYTYNGSSWISKPLASTDANSGWNDMLGPALAMDLGSPSSSPTSTNLRDGINALAFSDGNLEEGWSSVHISHDYVRGTNLYPHIHWTHNNASPAGETVRWGFEYTVARGYDVDTFPASTTIILEDNVGPQYTHTITEGTLIGEQIDGTNLDIDTVILYRVFRDGAHANDDWLDNAFLLYVDLHYQSDNSVTPERNYPFTKYI